MASQMDWQMELLTRDKKFRFLDRPSSLAYYATCDTCDPRTFARWMYDILCEKEFLEPEYFEDFLNGGAMARAETKGTISFGLNMHYNSAGVPQTMELFHTGSGCLVYRLLTLELPPVIRLILNGLPFITFWTAHDAVQKRDILDTYCHVSVPNLLNLEGALHAVIEPESEFFIYPQELESVPSTYNAHHIGEAQLIRIAKRCFHSHHLLKSSFSTFHRTEEVVDYSTYVHHDYLLHVTKEVNVLGRWFFDILISHGLLIPTSFTEFMDGELRYVTFKPEVVSSVNIGVDVHIAEEDEYKTIEFFVDGNSCLVYYVEEAAVPRFLKKLFPLPFMKFNTFGVEKQQQLEEYFHMKIEVVELQLPEGDFNGGQRYPSMTVVNWDEQWGLIARRCFFIFQVMEWEKFT